MTMIRNACQNGNYFLFTGPGFFGTALLDASACHTVVTPEAVQLLRSSAFGLRPFRPVVRSASLLFPAIWRCVSRLQWFRCPASQLHAFSGHGERHRTTPLPSYKESELYTCLG